ncbi:MAG: 50S ribosomal protein L24 [Deltaproteobacteria bacterium]|nr:50S ribosomal protein L24 [Deltaproteobacteria bacterium]
MSIRKNDIVVVIKGKKKGKRGRVLQVLKEKNRVIVENVITVKRHLKPGRDKSAQAGGIVEKPGSIAIPNVMLYCKKCDRGVRHGYKISGETKSRICKKCGEQI